MAGKEGKGRIPRFVAFTTLTYPENPDWNAVFLRCDTLGYPYAYCIHDRDLTGELDKPEEWKPDKPHCQSIIRVPNAKTVSAFAKKMGIEERWVKGLSSYQDYCRYINHSDEDSLKDPRKVCYPTDKIQGSMAEDVIKEIENHVTRNQARSKEDDTNILKILDFIEQFDYLPMTVLIRWCCESGYYSTLRRASGLIRDCVFEHNKSAQSTVQESILNIKVKMLEEKMTKQQKVLEAQYANLWERAKNPFTGKLWEDTPEYKESIAKMNYLLSEIEKDTA